MLKSSKGVMLILILVLSLTVFVGCGQRSDKQVVSEDSTSQIKSGGNVVVVVPQDPDYLDPHLAAAAGTQEMMFNVFEGLVKPDNQGHIHPAVASDYTVSEDGLVYTFTLRKGIKFHNGNLVTVDDVKYSLERLMGVETGEPLAASFTVIDNIETPDQQTVVITLKEFDASFLANLTVAILPEDNADHNLNPIGTGPFKFIEYVPEQRVVIEKFADYWKEGVPYVDKVEFRIIPDNEAALLSFKSGAIDIYPRIANERLEELGSEFHYVQGMQNMVQLMTMNIAHKPFDDIRVRRAINYAIDVDEIIEAVAFGLGTKLGSNMSPVMPQYYQEGLESTYNLNIERAKELLTEAGYEDGFKTVISVPANYQFHVDTAQVIASQLQKVGIDVDIELVEWGVWLDRIYRGRDYEMTIIGFTGKLDPHKILGRFTSDYDANFLNYNNSEYDELIKQATKTVDLEQRAELYRRAQQILTEDAAAVYIMDPNFAVAMKQNIQGYIIYPLDVLDMSTIYFTE